VQLLYLSILYEVLFSVDSCIVNEGAQAVTNATPDKLNRVILAVGESVARRWALGI